MELGTYITDLQRQLVDAAENGSDDTRAAAERLAAGLDAATRLVLLDVLSAAVGEIRVWGSADLIQTLAAHDLIDEYRLIVFPIVLGSGKRLFKEGLPRLTLDLAESRTLDSGLVVSIYRRIAS